ncbi:MAG TPA: M28 family peptidase [Candidatus Acidoferrales bacterium]|nr:M28 family peptidase [Candidatus Acidoferrales bacterium]
MPEQKVTIEVAPVPQEVVTKRFERLRSKDAEREAELKTIFEEAGCTDDRIVEEIVHRKDPPNIICTLPGTTNSLIIVGAHFDHAAAGAGAVDDWSGASLLPSLYQALRETPRKHTIQFIGFANEEGDQEGSGFHVKHLTKDQVSSIKAMINLECLGLSSTKVWAHAADQRLLGGLLGVAKSTHAPLQAANVEKVGTDDTQPFLEKKIPTITIHSITLETFPILHSKKDSLTAVHLDDLYESYRLAARYLSYLDQVLD